jgi:hypothetical protein
MTWKNYVHEQLIKHLNETQSILFETSELNNMHFKKGCKDLYYQKNNQHSKCKTIYATIRRNLQKLEKDKVLHRIRKGQYCYLPKDNLNFSVNSDSDISESVLSDDEESTYSDDFESESESEEKHPYSLEWFETNRKEQYQLSVKIRKIILLDKNVIVNAEEKSGKRVICEILALLDKQSGNNYKHIFITALNRKDIKSQLKEQEEYGVTSVILSNKKKADELKTKLENFNSERDKIIIHLDECDYGSGFKQAMSVFWKFMTEKHPNILSVLYSATPEEAIYATPMQNRQNLWKIVEFIPHSNYRGALWYLENNKVRPGFDFFKTTDTLKIKGFSDKAKSIITDLGNSSKCIGVIRIVENNKKAKKTLYNRIKDLWEKKKKHFLSNENQFNKKVMFHFADAKTPLKWSDETIYNKYNKQHINLIFICQTCTRSTEIHNTFKSEIGFWHDNRMIEKNNTKYSCHNTLSQAYGRIKYYNDPNNDNIDIILYGDRTVFEINSGRLSFEDANIKISSRMNSKKSSFDQSQINLAFFDTYDELIEKRREIYNFLGKSWRNPQVTKEIDTKDKRFRLTYHRTWRRMTVQELKNDKSWGINDISRMRIDFVYSDITNPTTLKYAFRWFLGERNESIQHTTSNKSQYEVIS